MMYFLQNSTPDGMFIRFNACFTSGELKEMYDIFEKNETGEQKQQIIANELRSFLNGLHRLSGRFVVVVGERFCVEDADPKQHWDMALFAQFQPTTKNLNPLDVVIVKGLLRTGSLPPAEHDIGMPFLRLPILQTDLPSSFHSVVRSLLASSSSAQGSICDRIARDIGHYLNQVLSTFRVLVIVGQSVSVLPPSERYVIYWGTADGLTVFVVQLGRI